MNHNVRLITAVILLGLTHAGHSQILPNGWERASWVVSNQNQDPLRNAWATLLDSRLRNGPLMPIWTATTTSLHLTETADVW